MMTFWMTGLSGSGKTTLVNNLRLMFKYVHLDGDILRNGLNSDLGFSREDRDENIRRSIEICKILNRNDILAITSFITPYEYLRNKVKADLNSKIIYVKCSLEECEKRDVKGLYKKARSGEIESFTGISDPYEYPMAPDLILDTQKESLEECDNMLTDFIYENLI